jgi:hypothetical protein
MNHATQQRDRPFSACTVRLKMVQAYPGLPVGLTTSPETSGSDASQNDDDQDDQQDRAEAAAHVRSTDVETAPAKEQKQHNQKHDDIQAKSPPDNILADQAPSGKAGSWIVAQSSLQSSLSAQARASSCVGIVTAGYRNGGARWDEDLHQNSMNTVSLSPCSRMSNCQAPAETCRAISVCRRAASSIKVKTGSVSFNVSS